MENGIIIAFGELFLKSKPVRELFIKRLKYNLSFYLKKNNIKYSLIDLRDRLFIKTDDTSALEVLKDIFGISWYSKCFFLNNNLAEFIENNYKDWIKENETFSLRIKAEGLDKEKLIGEIAPKIKRKVDLSNPDKEISIEIRKSGAYIYFEKEKGAGGLPLSGGKVLCLMSGGIDSPVASYLALKRGAENIWLHFHSFPLVSKASIEKTEELARSFLKYQEKLKVYFIPFSKAQMEIKAKAPAEYRVLLYRRLMLKIANKIADIENCKAIVTGESLGQVSSQTLTNMEIISEASKKPIIRPVISMDKIEIIKIAEKINSFETSIKPQEDCCTLFVSKHQTAEGSMLRVKEIEKKINTNKLIKECIKGMEVKNF